MDSLSPAIEFQQNPTTLPFLLANVWTALVRNFVATSFNQYSFTQHCVTPVRTLLDSLVNEIAGHLQGCPKTSL